MQSLTCVGRGCQLAFTLLLIAAALGVALLAPGVVSGNPSDAHSLVVSTFPDRAGSEALDGRTLSGDVYIFLLSERAEVDRVTFWLDDPAMTGSPRQAEGNAPYDFAGGSVSTASAFDTRDVADGQHAITAHVAYGDGSEAVLTTHFTVSNATPTEIGDGSTPSPTATPTADPTPDRDQVPPPEPRVPDQVHLSWVRDPSTTMTVVWRTLAIGEGSVVQYRLSGLADWQSSAGSLRASGTEGTLHEATLEGLLPGHAYEYRVLGDDGAWSEIYSFRTAPPPGPAAFEVAFVADTGLIGRADGLATGTAQVRDEIARLQPTLTLLGGDYAYYDTDQRHGTLEATIDAWFNQMQPIGAHSPMMPTYGNHEVIGGEGLSPWQARFATPSGHDGADHYSFDVGDAHFISILAPYGDLGVSEEALAWLDEDIAAAKARGQRWVIPFFHVAPFADGQNHPSNHELRRQFGPLFEEHDVQLVLTAHDQAYERSYPLVGVPAGLAATSSSLTCYDADDGTTWLKASPGGKLSNISGGFSRFMSDPPPAWTAVRDNSLHSFGYLTFSAEGVLRFEALGVTGDGSAPVIVDQFEYRLEAKCPGALEFDSPSVEVTLEEGETATVAVPLKLSDGAVAEASISEAAPWLTALPASVPVPDVVTLELVAEGLTPGSYRATVTAAARGHLEARLTVTLHVQGAHQHVFSRSADRSEPALLEGATVDGAVYVFLTPESVEIERVSFYLDDPGMEGAPHRSEGNAPYDLAGGTVQTALPFDTAELADGPHTLTARLELAGDAELVVNDAFVVANDGAPIRALLVGPDALTFTTESGAEVAPQLVAVSASDGSSIDYSAIADVSWITLTPATGTLPQSVSVGIEAAALEPGTHTGTVTVGSPTHSSAEIEVSFTLGGSTGGGEGYALRYSVSADRSGPAELAGGTVSGDLFAFLAAGDADIERVWFYLDDPTMEGSAWRSEGNAPYDFGGGSVATATAFDTSGLPDGTHIITARVDLGGGEQVVHAQFTVANEAASGPEESPDVGGPADSSLVLESSTLALEAAEGQSVAPLAPRSPRSWWSAPSPTSPPSSCGSPARRTPAAGTAQS